eukprot:361917-Chlamydomonas_euryale.AAC.14
MCMTCCKSKALRSRRLQRLSEHKRRTSQRIAGTHDDNSSLARVRPHTHGRVVPAYASEGYTELAGCVGGVRRGTCAPRPRKAQAKCRCANVQPYKCDLGIWAHMICHMIWQGPRAAPASSWSSPRRRPSVRASCRRHLGRDRPRHPDRRRGCRHSAQVGASHAANVSRELPHKTCTHVRLG